MRRHIIGEFLKMGFKLFCGALVITVMIMLFFAAVISASYKYDPPQAYERPSYWWRAW